MPAPPREPGCLRWSRSAPPQSLLHRERRRSRPLLRTTRCPSPPHRRPSKFQRRGAQETAVRGVSSSTTSPPALPLWWLILLRLQHSGSPANHRVASLCSSFQGLSLGGDEMAELKFKIDEQTERP